MSDKYKQITTAKVATFITEFEVAINKGKSSGVSAGDIATLYSSVEIKDPDSGDKLGSVRVPRGNFKVQIVAERYSTIVITDRADTDSKNPARVRALKKIVQKEQLAWDDPPLNSVVLGIGDEVLVRRMNEPDEPPF